MKRLYDLEGTGTLRFLDLLPLVSRPPMLSNTILDLDWLSPIGVFEREDLRDPVEPCFLIP